MNQFEQSADGGPAEFISVLRVLEEAMTELDQLGLPIISAQLSLAVEEIRSMLDH